MQSVTRDCKLMNPQATFIKRHNLTITSKVFFNASNRSLYPCKILAMYPGSTFSVISSQVVFDLHILKVIKVFPLCLVLCLNRSGMSNKKLGQHISRRKDSTFLVWVSYIQRKMWYIIFFKKRLNVINVVC